MQRSQFAIYDSIRIIDFVADRAVESGFYCLCGLKSFVAGFQSANQHGNFVLLRKSGNGSVINNLSLSVQTGGSGGGGVYAAAKGALQVMTRTLAKELAPQVRVNGIMPGVIATQHHAILSTPAKMEDYKNQTPLARNGTAEEVAQAVLFLASDAASFMTGAVPPGLDTAV